jgi:hypothetical protein
MIAMQRAVRFVFLYLGTIALGCGGPPEQPVYKTRAELLDPATCQQCHEKQFREWSGSMHAYASRDPVFLAMNRRGQEETGGALGAFCVKCHAPMAVEEGATTDGLNLGELPDKLQGVGCYFCHNVKAVAGTHNNPLVLANDVTMRGRFADPSDNPAHASSFSPLVSGAEAESSTLCGACHDIVLPSPPAPSAVALERTFTEWRDSVFAPAHAPRPSAVSTCTSCHMYGVGEEPIAEGPGLKVRPRMRHTHEAVGVDVALDPFPNSGRPDQDEAIRAAQRREIQNLLDITLRIDVCVQIFPDGRSAVHLTLDNAGAGHNWPSGASQDRRAWVEVVAYREGQRIYESGVAPPDEAVGGMVDADLWQFRDFGFKPGGGEAHMFWDIARVEHKTIGAQRTSDPSHPDFYQGHELRRFPRDSNVYVSGVPDRVTARVRLRPMGLDVIDDLVRSGHLDPSLRSAFPIFDLLPNRDLGKRRPELGSLAEVSMEWSAATRSSSIFHARTDTTKRPPLDCVGMPRGL